MLDSGRVGGESRVGGQFGARDCLTEPLPLTIIADSQHEVPVGGGERLIGNDLRVGVSIALRPLARYSALARR